MITSQYSKFQDIVQEIKTKIRTSDGSRLKSVNHVYGCPLKCLVCDDVEKEWAEKVSTILTQNEVNLERFITDVGPTDKPRFSLVNNKLHWMWGTCDCFNTEELLFHIARVLS